MHEQMAKCLHPWKWNICVRDRKLQWIIFMLFLKPEHWILDLMVYVKKPACLRVKKGKWSAFRKIAFAIYLRLMRFNSCWWIWENRIAGMEASTVILCSSFPRTLIKVIEWMHGKTRCCCCGDSPKIRCELQTRCQINFVQPTYWTWRWKIQEFRV